ncbi:MAG TPA: efflux RND transporter periplasmic adaptor subunit [Xanthobacteraceae bacterium]|jgi:multidrug efflux system membrane fusion protein
MRRWRVIFGLSVTAAGLAYFGTVRGILPAGPAPKASAVAAAIPVMAGHARRTDVPVYLTGLGTVQAFNSVLVKSRVDGQIVKINFSEGKDVRAGDILVEIDPAPYEATLAQAQANKLKDEAQLANGQLDLDRYSRLAATNAVSVQQLETARSLVAQLTASVKADQAMIDMAQVQLNYTRIRSPIDGRVGTRLVDAGNIVRATDITGVVTINQFHPIFVVFSLPSDSLAQIRAKMKAGEVDVTAQDRSGRDLANGKLSVIDNQINPTTGTINYKAVFDNADDVLWPGQFVNVRVQLDVLRDVIAVPVTVVQYGPDGAFAFVIGSDRIVEKRALKTGVLNKTTAVIEDGLRAGEEVVTEGQYRIQAGTPVEVITRSAETPG